MARPAHRTHTDAIITALSNAGLATGDAVAPVGVEPPYVVVYPIPGGRSYGTLADHAEDAQIVVQVTCVGVSRQQAEWLSDKCSEALLDGVSVPDRAIPLVTLDTLPGVTRDDDLTPPLYYATPRYRLFTTPDEGVS